MSTNGTNGHTPAPSRERIVREATYYAAIHGWYDTSEAAQRGNLLTVTAIDMATIGEAPPPDATHRLYVCINATGYVVTRYADGRYEVQDHDENERQREERELRTAALDYGLWHMTGEGAGYRLDLRPQERSKARAAMVKEVFAEDDEEEKREESDPVRHAVVRDEVPDISLAPGDENSPAPRVLRQWSVAIGGYPNYCEVGFIGYNPDGSPELIAVDAEPGDGEEDEKDEEDDE